ncbi:MULTISPECIES: dihydrofolate reductase [unclassified Paenibacillus]|uniref:dihydrofolate reductase n=1 Tax=unclassified Paenibacillus TaxID=185978 RepID=UPI001C1040A4|nr:MULTISPECIES: dihydrofolate reductase [unclassified Paenibacillus]MBU5443188.1 dihydrofolate reductase [Paenibacillus sp. MSJ-34]CAH0121411.1 IS1595 family transposase ISSsu9 [Paenibacillus sp. CECT 9249]
MSISLIWAMDRNRTIGVDNKLPWRLPADMAYFKRQTSGKTVLMGRKTFESIGKPLPNRTNVVLTRSRDFRHEGCTIVRSLEEALALAEREPLMVIGGAEIYRLLLPYADRLLVTEIDHSFAGGDAFFPEWDEDEWRIVESVPGTIDEKNIYPHTFVTYERVRGRKELPRQ